MILFTATRSGEGGMTTMSGNHSATSLPPFPPDYRRRACCCTSRRCLHLTASVILGRQRRMGRPTPRGGPKLVAVAAARPHGLRQLAVSAALFLRRQRPADQPGLLIEDGLLREEIVWGQPSRPIPSTTMSSFRTSIACSKRPGPAFAQGPAQTCEPPTSSFGASRRIGWTTTPCSER